MPTDVESLVGRTLGGRFRVVRLVGRGGMGAVFEAIQVDLDRHVALKVLFDDDPRAIARFRQEAMATARLRSPNVVAITDFVEPPDAPPFLVMDLLEGEPLGRLLAREKKLAPERAVGIALQILGALATAHAAGIVHRDIKPSNVFLVKTPAGGDVVKVLDFGVAKVLEGGLKTTTGAILGTPSYLAPEQILARPVGPATDIHAVGIVLHEMIAGARPWDSKEMMAAIAYEPPRPLEGAPPNVAAVVLRALAKDPAQRFSTAEAMIAALRETARAVAPPPRDKRPLALFAAAFGLTATLAVGAIVALAAHSRPVAAPPEAAPLPAPTPSASESAPPPIDSAPQPPPPDASVASAPRAQPLDTGCLCGVERSSHLRIAICLAPQTPRCKCLGFDNTYRCPNHFERKPDGQLVCPGGFSTLQPGRKSGDACFGYVRPEKDEIIDGTGHFECSLCYDVREGAGVHGAPCKGYGQDGEPETGKWDCLYRKR